MNMILSIIVCIAMLCSGTGSLPAQPETATTWTVRNLTIGDDSGSVTLAPEARFTTAIGSERAQLHFEIANGEQILMPVSGEITADGARFALGDSGNAYTISDETLAEVMDLDEADAQLMDAFLKFFKDYSALLDKTANDETYALEYSDEAMAILLAAGDAAPEETEVEIDGTVYPAQRIRIDLDIPALLNMLDAMRSCGIPELEALMADCVELFNLAMAEEGGEPFTSFADLADEIGETDFSYPIDLTTVVQDDFFYEKMDLSMQLEDEVALQASVEGVTRGDETDMTMNMTVGADETTMNYDIDMQMTGPMNAPEKIHMDYAIRMQNNYTYDYDEGEGEEAITHSVESRSEAVVRMVLDGGTVDGLENMTLNVTTDVLNSSSTDGEEDYSYSENIAFDLKSEERAEADGSVTAAVSMTFGVDGETGMISFDLNRAEGAPVDYFEGATEYAITAFGDAEDPAYTMLAADALNFSADAMTLAADESVIELMQLFGMEPEAEAEDADIESYDTQADSVTVTSFEEAAAIFEGDLPDYTTPEGYELAEITVSPDYFYAQYVSPDDAFSIDAYAGMGNELEYMQLKDGALVPLEDGLTAEVGRYSGSISYVSLYRTEGPLYFYFGDQSDAEVNAILAGLNG